MKGLGKFLSEAFFPRNFTCDICGIETFDGNICPDCLKTVEFNDGITCPVCGRKTDSPELCFECKADAPLYKRAVSALVYGEGATILIAKFKNGSGYLKDYFAGLIAKKLTDFPKADCIVYVPMTKKAELKRGYNQSELLAKSLSERINIPVLKDALIKTKDTSEQKTLSQKQRAENLKSCFKVEDRKAVQGKNVLIIDDILTTGATAEAISEKLLRAGAAHIYLATVASVEYKREIN